MLVIKLGGTNGSGKTTVARGLLKKLEMEPLENKPNGKILAYASRYYNELKGHRMVVLGSYASVCGGCDTISDKEERLALLRSYALPASKNIVFYEGLITGKTYGAMGAMSEEPGQMGRWLYAYMDTPYEVCVARVLERRNTRHVAKHGTSNMVDEFDHERTMRPTYKSVQSTAAKALGVGHETHWVNHKHTPAKAAEELLAKVRSML